MTYEQISKVLGVSLTDYNRQNNSLIGNFKVSNLLAKLTGSIDEELNFKKMVQNIFETCDALINQKASVIFERLEFHKDNITDLVGAKRLDLLKNCIYNEIAFRISTNQYPETINSVNLLSSSVNVYGDVRSFGFADSFLNPVAQRILINCNFENIEAEINDYLNNISVVGKEEFTQKISELSTYINSLNEERKQSILKLHALLQHERNLWTDAIKQNTFDLNRRLVMVELPLMNIQNVLNNQKETTENIKSDLESAKSTLLSVETKQREQITQGLENVKNDLLEKQTAINTAQETSNQAKEKALEVATNLGKTDKRVLALENSLQEKAEYQDIQDINTNLAEIQARMNQLENREPSPGGVPQENPQIQNNTNEIQRVATNLGKTNKRVLEIENLNLTTTLDTIKEDLNLLSGLVMKFINKGLIPAPTKFKEITNFSNETYTEINTKHPRPYNWTEFGLKKDR
ncbi:hypothetical protein [Mycoplasmopsis gallinacea]|uniref:Uncharacterized protein n=1 Tax=Mycoplasmopsis gallinacea TaxID=29556 RepID=A0A449A2C3_9BACT|nr:hypothetical protein [Mycoplasmopsis gallinacea]VEU58406.1 Uncharacterised protein [Mycoplasmopsis gallinacea]